MTLEQGLPEEKGMPKKRASRKWVTYNHVINIMEVESALNVSTLIGIIRDDKFCPHNKSNIDTLYAYLKDLEKRKYLTATNDSDNHFQEHFKKVPRSDDNQVKMSRKTAAMSSEIERGFMLIEEGIGRLQITMDEVLEGMIRSAITEDKVNELKVIMDKIIKKNPF